MNPLSGLKAGVFGLLAKPSETYVPVGFMPGIASILLQAAIHLRA
jgi:hypothetical protein